MADWIRMITATIRRSILGIDPIARRRAAARVDAIEKQVLALLTAAEANNAQRVVQQTGHHHRTRPYRAAR